MAKTSEIKREPILRHILPLALGAPRLQVTIHEWMQLPIRVLSGRSAEWRHPSPRIRTSITVHHWPIVPGVPRIQAYSPRGQGLAALRWPGATRKAHWPLSPRPARDPGLFRSLVRVHTHILPFHPLLPPSPLPPALLSLPSLFRRRPSSLLPLLLIIELLSTAVLFDLYGFEEYAPTQFTILSLSIFF